MSSFSKVLFVFAAVASCVFIENSAHAGSSERVYTLWDDQPAPNRGGNYDIRKARGYPYDEDWELHSYPLGNGYMGINFFGQTDVERIQLTEKTICNEGLYGIGGMASCAEIFLDFGHSARKNYSRSININEAVATVAYNHGGVDYTRELFMSYPDNVLAIRLTASGEGNLSFTLRPEIPYLNPENEGNAKTGTVIAEADLITLFGSVKHFSVNYEVQIKVLNDGGTLTPRTRDGKDEIRVENADSVVLLVCADTNYKLSEDVFAEVVNSKKLDLSETPHDAVSKLISNAVTHGYESLKQRHLQDYQTLFSRVELGFNQDIPEEPTRVLLETYQSEPSDHYLEELMFHYGRYLLISTSREGALPCGLQGVWSSYEVTPFTGGFWHNINVQMNYWGAFNTNLAETFTPYVEFHEAYRREAQTLATSYLQTHKPENVEDGSTDNGWTIGTGATPYRIQGPGGHSGPGTGALTTKLFWDYYDYTRDETFLRESAYPAIRGMSQFLAKTLVPAEDGSLLVGHSASPEQKHEGSYYITSGTTFDQGLVWENHNDLIKTAEILDITDEVVELAKEQVGKLDPILIGKSGQIKEFREEEYYGEIGQKAHRHISHLCALYPGTLINSNTKEWLDGSIVTLDLRGNRTTGWAMAHRMNCRARTKEAEKAHEVYVKFIRERTLPNLWTTHPPFQIDGNFGTMAGVAEMLIQSHEKYIELLPALPSAWSSGHYQGLVARGNFEISAIWEDGQAKSFEITSNKGEACTLKYPGIGDVQLVDTSGEAVPYTREGDDVIYFATKSGESYALDF
ncbi:glycoside hydrolase family 95 protein [Puniceicoccaceae bacterium K14]|nr:glycoside hydrolase family 95 protein [Puniceicoccaceae bacterium K14]